MILFYITCIWQRALACLLMCDHGDEQAHAFVRVDHDAGGFDDKLAVYPHTLTPQTNFSVFICTSFSLIQLVVCAGRARQRHSVEYSRSAAIYRIGTRCTPTSSFGLPK